MTYIYGVGKSRATAILGQAGIGIDAKIKDLSEDELNKIRAILDTEGDIEGDLRKRVPDGHQAFDGYRLLSRPAAQTRLAGSRPANAHKRTYQKRTA